MSHFIDNQAEESDHDDSDASSIGAPAAKRSKKQKKRQISDDEDEGSEDEDARIQEELGDFVVDEVDEAEDVDDDDDDNVETKSKGESEVSDLMDDELELINENIGRKVGGRVQLDSDDEDDDRTRVQNDLFGYGEEDDLGGSGGRNYETASIRSRSDSERSEDRFIVDDNEPEGGHGRRRKKQRKRGGFDDQILDEAKEVFGVDNIDEFYDEEEFPEEEMDDDEQRVVQQRPAKTTLLSAMEPSELDKGYMTSFDKGVTFLDKPERFQLRRVPVTEIEEDLLPTEVLWIFQYAFESSPLSKQDVKRFDNDKLRQLMQNGIRETLLFIRNQLFEVPFIAFYRKESIESLKISDLWKIYTYDEKFCLLEQRKRRLVELIERMDAYLKNSSEHENQPIVRPISYADKDSVRMVSTMEEFVDVNARFQLYYGNEITRMCEWEKISGKSDLIDVATKFKQSGRSDKYLLCMQCGLSGMAQLFGLDAEKFAENYSDYMKNDWTSHPVEPLMAAESFRCDNFPTEEDVLQGATYLLATQISRQPGVRRKLRERYRRKLNISVHPTKRGRDQIDRNSPLWPRRYIKDKPVSYLEGDEYLVYMQAKKNGLVEVKLYCDTDREREGNRTLLDSIETELYQKEDYAEVAQEWNKHRREAMRLCVNDFLMPVLEREAHERLLEEAQDFVLKSISQKVMERVAQAPYTKEFTYANEDEEEEGVRIMGVVYSSDPNEAAFAVVIDENGGVVDHQRFPHLYKRISRNDPHSLKRRELENLRDFIVKTNPHVIAMAGEDLEAIRLQTDISALIRQMKEDNEIPYQIPVEIVACDIAKVYMNSRMAVEELPSYPPVLRQSVALARCLLDPLVEFCHLCNTEDDILFVKFHPLQEEVAKQDLLTAIHRELINRVNEVGVDINRCLEFPHTAGMLQFVCGLGPRKAAQLLKVLKQNDNLLESRTKLVTFCRMGPKVFMNAAGFIKIDTVKVSERSEADAYVEVLDGSRVHPETYEWARKMAVDALEIDDLETEPSTALEEILSAPERLKDLDLDAFADELERQNFGNKSITLYDIRAELNSRYKDQRAPYKSPDGPALIDMLVPDISAFRTGTIVQCKVLYVIRKRPTADDLRTKQPEYIQEKNLWRCQLCSQEFVDGWSHVENQQCEGRPVGVKVRLDNGLNGFIPAKFISDDRDVRIDKRIKPDMIIHGRILSFDPVRMEASLTCRTSDLQRGDDKQDQYFDFEQCRADEEESKRTKEVMHRRSHFVKRVISHPSFHNVTYKDAEDMLRKMDQGEVVIRPSAKSVDCLTVTWKVADNVYQHITVKEDQKEKYFNLGKQLYIDEESFEDLDEILARHIHPMAAMARDVMSHKYYMEGVTAEDVNVITARLVEEKKRAAARIPYALTPSTKYPGKFVLSYLIKQVRHEFITALPNGLRFRGTIFNSVNEVIDWFKVHFREPPPNMKRPGF